MNADKDFEFLNHLNSAVADAFDTAFLLWNAKNKNLHSHLQQYCEFLLKEIIDYLKLNK